MQRPILLLALAIIFLGWSGSMVLAGQFEKFGPFGNGLHIISYKGAVESGDGESFLGLIEDVDDAIVILESPGGLVNEGLTIAATIARRGYSTWVPEGNLCASMCAVIWISGQNRYLNENSVVGFHAVHYRYEDGASEVSSSGNAEIGAYLNTLGVPLAAIRLLTRAGPDKLEFVDHKRARAYGIRTVVVDGGSLSPPNARPTPQELATAYGVAGAYKLTCQEIVPIIPASIDTSSDFAREQALRMVSAEEFEKLIYQGLDNAFGSINAQDTIRMCLQAEQTLRDSGFATGFFGPGFDCPEAETLSQQSLCREPDLWADDYLMNLIYLIYRDAPNSLMREKYFRGQRAWMTLRETCEGDAYCLKRQYDNRFLELYEIIAK